MQVIGLCRFSYPAVGGFQVEHATPQDRSAFLYAPDRMADRFRTFQTFTLPALRAQTDPDFTFVIVVGDDLPVADGNRLWDLTHDIPQVVIREYAPGPHREVMQKAINSVRDLSRPSLQFRLDDDDAVAVDFVQSLRAAGTAHAPALEGNRHIALDFPNGFIASAGPEGLTAMPCNRPFQTAALAVAFEPRVRSTVMNYSHVRLPRFMQCFTRDSPPMYIRGHNRWNDSRQGDDIAPDELRPLTPATTRLLRDRFAIDAAAIPALFAAP